MTPDRFGPCAGRQTCHRRLLRAYMLRATVVWAPTLAALLMVILLVAGSAATTLGVPLPHVSIEWRVPR